MITYNWIVEFLKKRNSVCVGDVSAACSGKLNVNVDLYSASS